MEKTPRRISGFREMRPVGYPKKKRSEVTETTQSKTEKPAMRLLECDTEARAGHTASAREPHPRQPTPPTRTRTPGSTRTARAWTRSHPEEGHLPRVPMQRTCTAMAGHAHPKCHYASGR